MRNKDLKIKIRDSFRDEAPDLLPKIEKTIATETQISAPLIRREPREGAEQGIFTHRFFKRAMALCACLLILATGILVGALIPHNEPVSPVKTILYLDVNPSVSIEINSEGRAVGVSGLNADAEGLISDVDISGADTETALLAIIGAMYMKGYLSAENNSILVSVENRGTEGEAVSLSDITDNINKLFDGSDTSLSIVARNIEVTEETK